MAMTAGAATTGVTTWRIDAAHTVVEFSVKHLMIATVKGRFGAVEGTLETRGDDASKATVDVTVDTKSVDTRAEQRDAHLRSPDFFDVERFPTITFRSTKVERTGTTGLKVTGDITIRGVTRPLILNVVEEGHARDPWGGERAVFSATGKVRRSDFGLNWNQGLEAGGVLVGDDINLMIDVQFVRA